MGRRPLAAKNEEKVPKSKPKSTCPSVEEAELQPEGTNPSLERVELQPENGNSSLKRVESPIIMGTSTSNFSSRKRAKKHSTACKVRRSERLQSAVMPTQNGEIERVIDEITLSESEKEDEQPTHEEGELPETLGNKSLEEKVDYLLKQLEAQQKTIEELKSKVIGSSSLGDSPTFADARYKSLYIDSQKKIEALKDENTQLSVKLENARSKLEAYEKGTNSLSEVLGKLKDVILVSHVTRGAENAVNVSSQAVRDAFNSLDTGHEARASSAKRTKLDKGSRKN